MTVEATAVCPFEGCSRINELASQVNRASERGEVERAPETGDVSFCIGCGRFAIFDKEALGFMRKPTDKEQFEIDTDELCNKLLKSWDESVEQFGRKFLP